MMFSGKVGKVDWTILDNIEEEKKLKAYLLYCPDLSNSTFLVFFPPNP